MARGRKKKFRACILCENNSDVITMHTVEYDGEKIDLCSRHYQRFKVYKRPYDPQQDLLERKCSVCGISGRETQVTRTTLFDDTPTYYCQRDYSSLVIYGRTKKLKDDIYECVGDVCTVTVHDKEGEIVAVSKFNKIHLEDVKKYKWHIVKGYLEGSACPNRSIHRLIASLIYGELGNYSVDHINRDRLDNTNNNLRLADCCIQMANQGINSRNTSGVRGVDFAKNAQKWRARINYKYKSKEKHCDSFDEAVALRKKWENEREENFTIDNKNHSMCE